MEINGMAHVMLTASNFEASRTFYEKLLPFLGLKPVIHNNDTFYCVGGRTALGIVRASMTPSTLAANTASTARVELLRVIDYPA